LYTALSFETIGTYKQGKILDEVTTTTTTTIIIIIIISIKDWTL